MTSFSTASRVQVSLISTHSAPETLSLKSSSVTPPHLSSMKNLVRDGCLASSHIMPHIRSMKDLVHDEKMVVATLATLEAGGPSHLIKEELKLVIQSRREAEGKEALKIEFSPPEKNELTPIDVERRERRRERNRLAAQRSRERGKRKMDELMQEIDALQCRNNELEQAYTSLSDERDQLKKALLDHLSECSSYDQPLNLSLKNT
ncbi:cyclic AMP-dependent transcription factor ATF-3-like [Gigantopelta aegis]|uniref:cyclic AMP-dependent transcription factor ATF-3-like n=1 Tax=Gigantopelta aegis TaxID=1735272 RepID=UPI001B88A2E1|nr:cyclic AMP-dependent transcription factor ATF-3-like [Gigantopelta aegis]